jgi:hypothetical protein
VYENGFYGCGKVWAVQRKLGRFIVLTGGKAKHQKNKFFLVAIFCWERHRVVVYIQHLSMI